MSIIFPEISSKKLIAAVGSALIDLCLLEDDSFLALSGAQKGGMTLVDNVFIAETLKKSNKKPAVVPGGSACNTILGVGKLGGKGRFVGKCGDDELGKLFETGLRNHNVEPFLSSSPSPTGHVLSIITPDAQRSMFTYLGASADTLPQEITPLHFEDAALVHIEGYLLFNSALMMAVLNAAKSAGAKISLDLASYTVVEASRDVLNDIILHYVDILIANEDEAFAFTGTKDEQESLSILSKHAPVSVLKVGRRGSYVSHNGKVTAIKPQGDGSAIDTTGAGDLWASGFLYGIVHGYSVEESGALGSACGYEVCQVVGASIPDNGWTRIKGLLRS